MSAPLISRLDSTGSPEAAVREIAETPELLAEARAVLPALKAVAEAKAGPEGVKAVVGRRLALYPPSYRDEAEAAAWWLDYYDVLSDVPLASLEAGMRAYVADPASEFMPKPGKLRELAFSSSCRSLARYYRARMAVRRAEETPQLTGPRADPADVKAMLAAFQQAHGRKLDAVKPKLPSIAGKPDATGITPEMRAVMARRGWWAERETEA